MPKILFFLALCVWGASAGTHSFKAFYTATTGITHYPEFTIAAFLDDTMMFHYDSISRQVDPRTEWMKSSEGPEYWKQQTDISVGSEQASKNNIQVAMSRFNQTGGVHTNQMMYGCELDDDGTKRGYSQDGYDGEDFISLDMNTVTWIATNPQAMTTKVKWEANRAIAEQQKAYLENTCIEWLQKYVRYGKDTLERKVSPQVFLQQKSSSVSCLATGFHPKAVTISWKKNGEDHDEDVDLGQLLPNEDGTFQKTSILRVSPEELKKNEFSCVVEHQGDTFRETLTDGSLPIGIIVGVIVAIILLAVIAVVVFKVVQKKKKPEFKAVNGSDDGSNNS